MGLKELANDVGFRLKVSKLVEREALHYIPVLVNETVLFLREKEALLKQRGATDIQIALIETVLSGRKLKSDNHKHISGAFNVIDLYINKERSLFSIVRTSLHLTEPMEKIGFMTIDGIVNSHQSPIPVHGFECMLFDSLEELTNESGMTRTSDYLFNIDENGRYITLERGPEKRTLLNIGSFELNGNKRFLFVNICRKDTSTNGNDLVRSSQLTSASQQI